MDQDAPADQHAEIREEVRKLCARFPGEYWRKLDHARAYPDRIRPGADRSRLPGRADPRGIRRRRPAAVGRRRNPGNHPRRRLQRRRLPRPDVHHGHHPAARLGGAEDRRYLPKIATGELRLQAFGVTEPTTGTDTTSLRTFARREGDHYVVNGQKVWTSRAEHSDLMLLLARTTPREQAQSAPRGCPPSSSICARRSDTA